MGVENPPVRTPDPLTGSRRRALERLGSGLRAMGLGAIGDIGSNAFSQITTSAKTWETATDWDNAVSESSVSHSSDVISMVRGAETWDDLSAGSSAPSPPYEKTGAENVSTSQSLSGSNSMEYSQDPATVGTGTIDGTPYLDFSSSPETPTEITMGYWEYATTNSMVYAVYNENADFMFYVGSQNPQVVYTNNGGEQELVGSPNPSYETWRKFTLTLDYANNQYDLLWEDIGGSTGDQTATGVGFDASATGIGGVAYGVVSNGNTINGFYDDCYGVYLDSSLTTATKSFSSSVSPDLQNLSYTLNSQNITLDVIGSPGTASEEIVSQPLDGSTGYSLSWSNSHTDFRVKVNLNSTDRQTSPSLSRVELLG